MIMMHGDQVAEFVATVQYGVVMLYAGDDGGCKWLINLGRAVWRALRERK